MVTGTGGLKHSKGRWGPPVCPLTAGLCASWTLKHWRACCVLSVKWIWSLREVVLAVHDSTNGGLFSQLLQHVCVCALCILGLWMIPVNCRLFWKILTYKNYIYIKDLRHIIIVRYIILVLQCSVCGWLQGTLAVQSKTVAQMWREEQKSSCNPDVAQILIGIWDKQVGKLEWHLSYFI